MSGLETNGLKGIRRHVHHRVVFDIEQVGPLLSSSRRCLCSCPALLLSSDGKSLAVSQLSFSTRADTVEHVAHLLGSLLSRVVVVLHASSCSRREAIVKWYRPLCLVLPRPLFTELVLPR